MAVRATHGSNSGAGDSGQGDSDEDHPKLWEEREARLLKRLATDSAALEYAVPLLDGVRFRLPGGSWFWKHLRDQFNDHHELIDIAVLRAEVLGLPESAEGRDIALEAIGRILDSEPIAGYRGLTRSLLNRSRRIAALTTIQAAVESFDRGRDDVAYRSLKQFAEITSVDRASLPARALIPSEYIRPAGERSRIPTGLREFDRIADGLGRRETGLILGETGVGKSQLCVNIAVRAIRDRLNVLYIDTENGPERVPWRFIARFLGIPSRALENGTLTEDHSERLASWMSRNSERLAHRLKAIYLVYMENTLDELSASIAKIIRGGFKPDLVVFDSPDHLLIPETRGGSWEGYRALHNGLRGMSQSLDVPLWITSQIGAEWAGRIAPAHAVADSRQKARNASIVISINRVPVFPEDEGSRRRRSGTAENQSLEHQYLLFVGKNRNRASGQIIPLRVNLGLSYIQTESQRSDGEQ